MRKDNVLDEHGFDLDAPAESSLFDNFANRLGDFLATFNHILEHTCADDVAESRLGPLNEGLADVADAESGLVWRRDAVVNDRGKLERNIILGHANLLGHFDNLDLNVDLDELLGERVDVHKTWVNGASEATKLGHKADVTLINGLVRVRADDTARNSSQGADTASECVDLDGY